MNIKQKLIITFLSLSLIPLFVISGLFLNQAETSLKENRIAQLDSIANLKAAAIEAFMDEIKKDAAIAQDYFNIKSNLPLVTRFADDRKNPAYIRARKNLDSQLKTLQKVKEFADIMLLSPEGKVVYVTNQAHAEVDMDKPLINKQAFEEGRKRIYISNIIEVKKEFAGAGAAFDLDFEMLVTAPLFGLDGGFIGVLALEIDMQPVHALVQQTTGLGDSGETLIARNMGDHALFLNTLRHDPMAAMHRKAKFGHKNALPVQEAVQGSSGSGLSTDYRGVEVIASWRYLPSLGWGMVTKIDATEAFQSIKTLREIAFVIGFILLITMVLLAIGIARTFSKPIQALQDGIAIIGAGNLEYRVGTDRKDEIGKLSRAFDAMAANLKSATASREDFEKEIAERKQAEEAMVEKNREIAMRNRYESSYAKIVSLFSGSLDQDEMLTGMLAVLAEQHPFPASAIYIYDEWSGQLKLSVDHGINSTLPHSFELGEGVIGQALRDGRLTILDEMADARILSIDAGLLSFAPAAVIIAPVCYQGRSLAVLALACSKSPIELDRQFVERLTSQLGVTLYNVAQHQALTDLAEQLQTHGDEIRHKNAQLEQASRMKSEFLANMSHELRTPLNAIIGFSEVLKDGIIGELDKDQLEYVSDIFSSGKHLLSLINDILDLSKIEAGKMELNIEAVNVTDMLRNSVSIIKEKAATHHIQLECDLGEALEPCYMDGRKVKQAIYNLLSNAIKFTKDKGVVSLMADTVAGEAVGAQAGAQPQQPLQPELTYLQISVSDTGIGIAEEDIKRLFTPFHQLESTMTKEHEGTGLGLVMVKRLVELHGGEVGVRSVLGEGSTFSIWVPYQKSEAQALATAARAMDEEALQQAIDGHGRRVLMVEDDEKAAALMRVQLLNAGYSIRHAVSAEQALEMLSEEQPDLITLDIVLPGMDGWDFMQRLKQRAETAAIPVVVVSIVADSEMGFSLGAADVLQKPVERKMLLGAIAKLDFSLEGKRVLVVDDDAGAVELVSRHLSTVGCDVLKAYGGQEAIDIATAERPDAIILDLMMPGVSGFDVIAKLKKRPELADVPIMILTAKVLSDEDRRQLNGDIVKVMQKSSFNHGSFINEVNRAAHGRRQPEHKEQT
jgi:signal transduction histidine kinase/DNA-binding response OmpR family regulator/HAMP domain-containing protein